MTMPSRSPITPDSIRSKRSTRSSVLNRARQAKEITRRNFKFKALLLGDSGGGKSTSAITLPGQKLVIELDGREESLAGFENVTVLSISEPKPEEPVAWSDLLQLTNEIWGEVRASRFPYDSVIIDGITSLSRYAMNYALTLKAGGKLMATLPGGAPSQAHYIPQMTEFSKFCHKIHTLPCHIAFTGHVDIYEDQKLKTIDFYPKVIGKTRTEISSWFNETYLCVRERDRYLWKTAPFQRYSWLKSAANQLGKFWDKELEIDLDQKPCGFEKILDLRFGKETL